MSDVEDPQPPVPEKEVKLPPPPGMQQPPATPRDPSSEENHSSSWSGFGGVAAIVKRWKREDFIKRSSLVLRGLTLLFSLLSFIIIASNKHGDLSNFDEYEEYRYLLAVAIFSTVYSGSQVIRHVYELHTKRQFLTPRTLSFIDFFGDQTMAYMLMSASSAAIPLTKYYRELFDDNTFAESSAGSISMAFFAFMASAVSAAISGYKLSTQSYI